MYDVRCTMYDVVLRSEIICSLPRSILRSIGHWILDIGHFTYTMYDIRCTMCCFKPGALSFPYKHLRSFGHWTLDFGHFTLTMYDILCTMCCFKAGACRFLTNTYGVLDIVLTKIISPQINTQFSCGTALLLLCPKPGQ